jgi:hypothetical protein
MWQMDITFLRGFLGESGDQYVGQAVDDAIMLGEDLQPIMVTSALAPPVAGLPCHRSLTC